MKKNVKKLTLNRESVRLLESSDAQWVAGGYPVTYPPIESYCAC